MTISTIVNIEFAILGFTAGVFFAIGTASMRAVDIKNSSTTFWGYNAFVTIKMIRQKADYILGSLFLCTAFLSQVFCYLLIPESYLSSHVPLKSGLLLLGQTLVLIVILSFLLYKILNESIKNKVIKQLKPDAAEHLLKILSQK